MSATLLFRWTLLALLCFGVSACAGRFDRRWRSARLPTTRWTGTWQSTRNTHSGKLECLLTPAGPGKLHADFKAHWLAFTSSYEVDFETRRRGQAIAFSGEKDLGFLYGGVYRYRGELTPQRFDAAYDSSYDTGTFTLRSLPENRPSR